VGDARLGKEASPIQYTACTQDSCLIGTHLRLDFGPTTLRVHLLCPFPHPASAPPGSSQSLRRRRNARLNRKLDEALATTSIRSLRIYCIYCPVRSLVLIYPTTTSESLVPAPRHFEYQSLKRALQVPARGVLIV
jgi:hypothetical protein